jgi:hypothetical protein
MSDISSSDSISSVMELANNAVESTPAESFMTLVTKKFSENKMYVYIGIAVIVLGIILYYFYIKNKKETKSDNKPKLNLPLPAVKQPEALESNNPNTHAGVPEITGDEYWVMDAQGRPVKVSGGFPQAGLSNQMAPLPVPKQAPSAAEIKMIQQQMIEQQMFQQQMEQQKRLLAEQKAQSVKKASKKIKHPEESEKSESDDIDVELARINANEDENVAQHNLTNSELAEITKKLEIMGSQLGSV